MLAHRPNFLQLCEKSSSPKKMGSSHSATLVPIEEAPRARRAPHTRKLGIPRVDPHLSLPRNRVYIQITASSNLLHVPYLQVISNNEDPFSLEDNFSDHSIFSIYSHNPDIPHANYRNAVKRQRQWTRWKNEIIPSLLKPYLAMLNETCNLRDPPSTPSLCNCTCVTSWKLKVICMYFDRKSLG